MKRLYLVGLSHKTAPIAVRERFALTGETLKDALTALHRRDGVDEAMVLSTCNRVEVYARAESDGPVRRFFLDIEPEAGGHLYAKLHEDAARHLFRVAASLDSMVVGEQQILGQVKEAYGLASAAETAGSFLSRLCNRAFATAKRVRTETDIGRGATSVSQVAVELVEKIFGDLKGRAIALVGAGKMGALSAKALASLGANRVFVTNRSPERARALAEQVGGSPRPWEELTELLAETDVAIVSTGAPSYVITPELVKKVMKVRRHRSMCFIDLAVPRNVDPACGEQADVYAYDMDDLDRVVHASKSARAEAALRAEAIVEAELMAFAAEREARAALPVLHALRRQAEAIARAEAARTLQRVGGKLDDKGRQSVEAMAKAIVNKLLHLPTVRLKDAAQSGDPALPGLAAQLFGIEPEAAVEADPARPLPAPPPAAVAGATSLPENR
ncbi:MAG: glutamyl-tRNA reductase [Deltaproteobacteria bacterium]|nr:glutamyl-tRNA reductase [Deltaproteobacteria bacterium]